MVRRIQIDERLVREAADEIQRLRKRLADLEGSPVRDAIQKSLEQPATGNGRNRVVSDLVRAGLFLDRSTPIKKAEREQTAKSRKEEIRRARNEALGIINAKRGR